MKSIRLRVYRKNLRINNNEIITPPIINSEGLYTKEAISESGILFRKQLRIPETHCVDGQHKRPNIRGIRAEINREKYGSVRKTECLYHNVVGAEIQNNETEIITIQIENCFIASVWKPLNTRFIDSQFQRR